MDYLGYMQLVKWKQRSIKKINDVKICLFDNIYIINKLD